MKKVLLLMSIAAGFLCLPFCTTTTETTETVETTVDVKLSESSFKVFGNCGMCKERIEKAATTVEGVSNASWDSETKMITLTYNEGKANLAAVHKAIAAVGHSTDKETASDEVYNELPGCCQYKEGEGEMEHGEGTHEGHTHE